MKKALWFILFLLTPFIVFAYPMGDVNGDNKVDIMDYQKIRSHIIWAYYSKGDKTKLLTGDALKRADVNGKNGVDNGDYADVRKIILNNLNSTTSSTPSPTNTPKATATPQPTKLTEAEKICESVKSNNSIDYKSFLSLSKKADSSDKYKDDYYAIKAAHDCANKYNKEVKVTKGTYHIYKKNKETITVQTNTDFSDSLIYIHNDEDIYNYMKAQIFTISPNSSNACTTKTMNGFTNKFESLAPSSGNYYVKVTEKDGIKVFSRYHNCGGEKTCQETAKTDAYRVYNNKVQDPMYWDYKNSKIEYEVCPIPNVQLIFKNAVFKSVVNDKCSKCASSSGTQISKSRGIAIRRSNTQVYNIRHSFVNPKFEYTHEIQHRFSSFFSIEGANIILEKCVVYSMYFKTSNGHGSTYDLHLKNAVNITLKGVTMSTADKNYNQLKNSNDWGVMSSHGSKNVLIINSTLNRIDAHKGIYNLTVKKTTVGYWGINIVGTGDYKDNKLILENVTWKYSRDCIKMRNDYGTTWNGTITIKNSKIVDPVNSVFSIIIANLTTNMNPKLVFNQPIYNPTKVAINGLTIKSSNVTKVQVFNAKKSEFDKYYLNYFNKNKQNESTKITGTNTITGVKTIANYAS